MVLIKLASSDMTTRKKKIRKYKQFKIVYKDVRWAAQNSKIYLKILQYNTTNQHENYHKST